MAARSGTTKITDGVFNAIKVLLKGGATYDEAAEYMNVSRTSVHRIANSDDYEAYKQNVNAYYFMKKKMAQENSQKKEEQKETEQKQVVEYKQTVTVQATHYMMEELRKQNELLDLISKKLTFIVEQLA